MAYQYYGIYFKNDDGGVARAPEWAENHHFDGCIRSGAVPFNFDLSDGVAQDYLGNDLGWPMMSDRMRAVVEGGRTPEGLSWISAVVVDRNDPDHVREINYHIPHFAKELDILNREQTLFADHGGVIRPHYDVKKLGDLDFFIKPGSAQAIVVSRRIKRAMQAMGLTGISFEPVRAS